MNQKIKIALSKIFHDSAIAELRLLHNGISNVNLTYNDILYLSIIEAHSGEYTASNIADMLYVSRPAVTQKLNELEKEGYIYKVQSKEDRRVYKLFTNKEGKSCKYYEVVDQTNQDIVEAISKDYSDADIELFCEMTDRLCTIILNESVKQGLDRGAK